MELKINTCPSCGKKSLQQIKADVKRKVGKRIVVIPAIVFEKCSECGEELYGSDALDVIDRFLGLDKKRKTG